MLYLVTGGSGSGKSEYAERLAVECSESDSRPWCQCPRIYLATMRVWDEEGRRRVLRHRAMRAEKGFYTVERYTRMEEFHLAAEPEASAGGRPVVLLECMSNLAANEYYREKEGTAKRVLHGICRLNAQCRDLIVVTNEVFSDGILYGEETEEYMEILGEINCRLGRLAGSVTEVVCGLPVKYK